MNTGNGVQLYIVLVGCHPSDSHLAIQFVDSCKWLVYVASLLDPMTFDAVAMKTTASDIREKITWLKI